MTVISFTGHRPDKLNNDYSLTSPLVKLIASEIITEIFQPFLNKEIFKYEGLEVIVGGALGIDTLVALLCIQLEIPFTVAIPFKGQERVWPQVSKDLYYNILSKAKDIRVCDIVRTVSYEEYRKLPETPYIANKMDDRNRWMVDNSNRLCAVYDGSAGGTKNCIRYAELVHRYVKYISITELREKLRELAGLT